MSSPTVEGWKNRGLPEAGQKSQIRRRKSGSEELIAGCLRQPVETPIHIMGLYKFRYTGEAHEKHVCFQY